jgi:hypothetical protein
MPTTIAANNIPISMRPELYEAAVQEAMRHNTDDCQAYLVKLNDRFGVGVRIVCSRGKSWAREFLGLDAQPEYIRRTIEDVACLLD